MNISKIIEAINANRIRITDHAKDEAYADNLIFDNIIFSVAKGEIIEDYPADKPYPSCLIYGQSESSEPLHTVWAYNENSGWAVLITVYRPDRKLWIDYKRRIKP